MTDKMKVYTKVLRTLKQSLPCATQRHVVVLAMLVSGIVTGKSAQLSKISLEVPHNAKPASLVKRFHRFVKNERVQASVMFMPFAEQIVTHLSQQRLYLAMDGSVVGRGCMTLMVGVIYKQRAIPLVWLVYKGKKGHTTAERHIAVLRMLQELIPATADVVLLGDAEYDTVAMLRWLRDETRWSFVVRTAPQLLITHAGLQYPIRDLLAGLDSCTMATDALFTQHEHGPLSVLAWWERPHKHPIYLLSNQRDLKTICADYSKRFKLETLFSDKKSRGFNIHKSHIADPQRLTRLLVAAALAYMWIVYLGVEVASDPARRSLVDRTHRSDKSLFRLGLDWLVYALTHGLDFNVQFEPPGHQLMLGVR